MVCYDVTQVIDTLASNNLELRLDVLNADITMLEERRIIGGEDHECLIYSDM